jgi:hypothetical protein
LDREVVEEDLMETSLESEELRLLRALRIESLSESVFWDEPDLRFVGSSSEWPRAARLLRNLPIRSSEECLARWANDSEATFTGLALGGVALEIGGRSLLLLESDRTERIELDRWGVTFEVGGVDPVRKSVTGFCFTPL